MLLLLALAYAYALAAHNLGINPDATVEASVHDGYEVVGCHAAYVAGVRAYWLYTNDDINANYQAHSFTLYRVGDDNPGGGWLCDPGYGLPPAYLVDNGTVGP